MTATGPAGETVLTQPVSTIRVGRGYLAALGFAQFGLFVALLSPVFVSMQLKAQQLAPDSPETLIGQVLPIGALGALFANPLMGAISDRTRTRWGRRRPYLVGGVILLTVALALVAFSPNQLSCRGCWPRSPRTPCSPP
jgi:MFS family permease